MLHAIRDLWGIRLPFFGINCGHVGYLLNDIPTVLGLRADSDFNDPSLTLPLDFLRKEMTLHNLPLLRVEVSRTDGTHKLDYAFNDVWVERSTGQAAWIKISVNGEEKIDRLIADGVLISTAAGSTAYAQAMGASPLPVGSPVLILVGSNVGYPPSWRPAYLPIDAKIQLECLDISKRPIRGFVDGAEVGGVVQTVNVHVSNTAGCRLLFLKDFDISKKLNRLQFPRATSDV
eukprot:TRINITY_DN131_c0_g2_i2.p2 TRINITY_DN131_c0_g2~~TRINITY_DN131_c0_g2_i2.p2  ORF type:complete len:246 (+),score=100.82 TRINITY_DN131_c0_g2_i2:45-740(+)